jgi:PAS domain S-box-containing protein
VSVPNIEGRSQELLEKVHLIAVILDASGRVEMANDFLLRLTAWSREEVVGRSWFEMFVTPEAGAAVRAVFEAGVVSGEIPDHYENEIITRSGERRVIAWNNVVLRDNAGVVTGTTSLGEDITARRQAEQAILDSEIRYRGLYERMLDAFVRVTMDGRIIECNEAYCTLTGYSRKELFALTYHDLTIEKWHARDARVVTEEVLPAGFSRIYEKEYRRKDGTVVPIELRKYLELSEQGTPASMWAMIRDISERKKAEEEIRRLNAELRGLLRQRTSQLTTTVSELEGFAHSVSHDLRAPLRAISGWSLALKEDYSGQLDETANKYLDTIRSEAARMNQLVDGLLQISRAARAEITNEVVDVSSLVRQIQVSLSRPEPERRVEFLVPARLEAKGDPNLIRIALKHLLDNAWKFTKGREKGTIEVGSEVDAQGRLVVFVRDNGAGFEMAQAHKLFRPFQRLHSAEEFPGPGIGLATVQRIVHRHGGAVWAVGEAGVGATFFFTLEPEVRSEDEGVFSPP